MRGVNILGLILTQLLSKLELKLELSLSIYEKIFDIIQLILLLRQLMINYDFLIQPNMRKLFCHKIILLFNLGNKVRNTKSILFK